MRSFWVQIIAVIGMILVIVLAVKYRDVALTSLPELPTLPSFKLKRDEAKADLGLPCPASHGPISDDAEPVWTRPPQPVASDFPIAALDAGVSGRAEVECQAYPDGHVADCQIAVETPTGYGFGDSAKRIVQRGCLTPFSETRGPVSFTVRVPFNLD